MIKKQNPKYIYRNGIELDFFTDDKTLIEVKYGQQLTNKQQVLFDQTAAKRKIIINGYRALQELQNYNLDNKN